MCRLKNEKSEQVQNDLHGSPFDLTIKVENIENDSTQEKSHRRSEAKYGDPYGSQ